MQSECILTSESCSIRKKTAVHNRKVFALSKYMQPKTFFNGTNLKGKNITILLRCYLYMEYKEVKYKFFTKKFTRTKSKCYLNLKKITKYLCFLWFEHKIFSYHFAAHSFWIVCHDLMKTVIWPPLDMTEEHCLDFL